MRIFYNIFRHYMYYEPLILKLIYSSFSHKSRIKYFKTSIIFTICIAKIIPTITTTSYLNFAISSEINMANIFPKFHKS